ncbi:acyl-CoA dehydrogenase [Mangrovicoccus sp. HB161399]|uniref:acyl-CoA dehydrogenase n=1 Tax=Mangrovicoccus sp. HB161399 TaxID=2720392 RepID=UPI001551F21B|nr:acyl-CoA dehydrogenase [Mangrovicoccus sp. HB161399]
MTYSAPLKDMQFILEELCGLDALAALPGLEDATPDTVAAILEEAGKFAGEVLAPLNRSGDLEGLKFADGKLTTPAGWKEAYGRLVEMGWNSPSASPEHGGMGLPQAVNTCIQEMFQGANMSFQLCPMLTQGAIEALEGYASDALKEAYLPKLVSGEWTGTMNLTEPQAGSDLAAIRSRAEPEGDHFLVSGQKIFITYGTHDLTDNIIHLVLARLPDAPAGVKGISLFLVPQFMPDGTENDVRCVSIEHKLGIHASPTCTLAFGDKGGATGWLIGEPNKGLQYMFAMMNNARLNVGVQGIGVAEHAYQWALAYARERRQGTPSGGQAGDPILGHGDVRRMVGAMRARTLAARALACLAAASLDHAARNPDAEAKAYHQRRVDLMIPVVKGWGTEMAVDVANMGVQVHGGMGFVEETGAAQFYRDARITTIYEGTTGIQALDLVGRKITRDGGRAAGEIVAQMRADAEAVRGTQGNQTDWAAMAEMIDTGAEIVSELVDWLLAMKDEPALQNAAAVNVLHAFGVALGGWQMGYGAHRAALKSGMDAGETLGRIRLAEFFRGQIFPEAMSRRDAVTGGSEAVAVLPEECFA